MNRSVLVIFAVCATCSATAEFESLREAVDSVATNLNRKTLRVFTEGEIGGQRVCRHPSYQALAHIVSNDDPYLESNLPD